MVESIADQLAQTNKILTKNVLKTFLKTSEVEDQINYIWKIVQTSQKYKINKKIYDKPTLNSKSACYVNLN